LNEFGDSKFGSRVDCRVWICCSHQTNDLEHVISDNECFFVPHPSRR
jgi:hypothetical protein